MSRKAGKKRSQTPTRQALKQGSSLLLAVRDGLGAVETAHRHRIEQACRPAFADSMNLDEALRAAHGGENRWDYLLGHGATRVVVGLEPHSAKSDQVSTVIRKRQAALDQLRHHLADGARIAAWFWVASGSVQFADTDKEVRRLDQAGITFVGQTLRAKHLPT